MNSVHQAPAFFDPGLQDVAVADFDQAGPNGQIAREGVGVIELLGAIAQLTEGRTHGAFSSGISGGSSRGRNAARTLG